MTCTSCRKLAGLGLSQLLGCRRLPLPVGTVTGDTRHRAHQGPLQFVVLRVRKPSPRPSEDPVSEPSPGSPARPVPRLEVQQLRLSFVALRVAAVWTDSCCPKAAGGVC